MRIHGLQKMSLVDYPGKVACTVFLGGCDFRCPYCHNAELLSEDAPAVMDDIELLEGSREDLRAREDLPHPFQKEEHEAAHEAEAAEAGRPEPGTEVSGHVEHLSIASSWKAAWEHRDRRT